MRRTKDLVLKELPPKVENVLFCDMDEYHKDAYNRWRDYYRMEILALIDEEGMEKSKIKILEGLTKLRQVSIHPRLVDESYRKTSGKTETLWDLLEDVRKEGHKALVFSQFVKALTLVRKRFDEENIPYCYLDGRTKNRQEEVDRFQTDEDIKIFLISLKAGGTGLNLTAADYVIHIDPWWNPAVENQATDRAHRMGQDKKVFVYKLITKGTVEEKILQLQEKKRDLANDLISSDAAFFKNISKDDIKTLFS
jgi:non-specific serine/threonine protein kinase